MPYFRFCMLSDVIWYISFCLTSLSMTISRFIHVAANGIISFFFYGSVVYIYIYIAHIFFIEYEDSQHQAHPCGNLNALLSTGGIGSSKHLWAHVYNCTHTDATLSVLTSGRRESD